MVWAKLDDQFHASKKLGWLEPDLMLAAVGLHTLALSYCANQLTDGHIPTAQVVRLAGQPVDNLVAQLLQKGPMGESGLWERAKGGFQIHDYLDYNPSRAQVLDERKRKSEGGRRGGFASGKARREAPATAYPQADARGDAWTKLGSMLPELPELPDASGASGTPVPVLHSNIPNGSGSPVDNSKPDDFKDIDFGEEEPEVTS